MRVLAWPGFAHSQQPYIVQLYRHLEALGTEVTEFSPFVTLKETFDVWHMHWPENRLIDPNPLWAGAQASRLLAEMHAAKLRGTKIVWTAHNLKQHEGRHPHLEPHFWRHFTRMLDGWIALSPDGHALAEAKFPALRGKPSFIVPLGHYRGYYRDTVSRTEARRVLGVSETARVVAFAGHIRPYKNVPHLIRTFRQLPAQDHALLVVGRSKGEGLEDEITAAAGDDPRIKLFLTFVPNDDMQLYLRASDLLALPYKDILNSSSAMLALSFGVPVLVPAIGAMGDLQRYAGERWVRTFEGDLSAQRLAEAVRWAAAPRPALKLTELSWERLAQRTLSAYKTVCTGVPTPTVPNAAAAPARVALRHPGAPQPRRLLPPSQRREDVPSSTGARGRR
jgi:beta-1,4-mannosyltransferase